MLSSFCFRPAFAKLVVTMLMSGYVFGWITFAQAAESSPQPVSPSLPPNALPAVRRALREFDRFLDHHPLLEDQLRVQPQLATAKDFLSANPKLRDFFRINPNVVAGLKVYPRYYLYRALLREANAPLPYTEIAPFKELFEKQPALEQDLTRNPWAIRDPVFLNAHAPLREFLAQHATLARVFQPVLASSQFR